MNEGIQQIGPYTVEAEIGRCGMGVVYSVTDTRLGRTVAIKALPEELAHVIPSAAKNPLKSGARVLME